MINKSLEQINKEDLERLIQNSVSEKKTIEYKIRLSLITEQEKGEFLADVSSFANTSGGDLIFGIKEENGLPKSIDGICLENIDSEKLKIESIIRDGLEPRIQTDIHTVNIDNEKNVLIIRIHKSWLSPHRVIFTRSSKHKDQFYARHSSGKYSLDTGELRTAFGLSDTLVDKIKNFRTERISSLIADSTPVPFNSGGKIILHLIPLEAFSPNIRLDINQMMDNQIINRLKPIYCSGWNHKINLEGFLTYSGRSNDNKSHSYVQLYRNGIIEAVEGAMLNSNTEKKRIPSVTYEKKLLNSLPSYLNVLKDLNISTPIFIFLAFTGIKGFEMSVSNLRWTHGDVYDKIDRDILMLPECLIKTYDIDPKDILRPMFDLIWNACGFKRSLNFDNDGN